jgi:steroid delta-isomerase-like uncharacterized protein
MRQASRRITLFAQEGVREEPVSDGVVPLYAPLNVSVEDNIEVVRRLGEALSGRDWAVFEELVAEDIEWTDVPSGRTIRGVKDLVDACRTFTTAFPDFSVESMTLIGQGDVVANEWSARGTHNGPLPRADGDYHEPTGRSFARMGVGIVELRDGKIVRYRDHFDRQTIVEQLGLDQSGAVQGV